MMQPGNHIFDLLLGSTDAGQVMPAVSQADPSAEGSLLFGDILGGLITPGDLSAVLPTINKPPVSAPAPGETGNAGNIPQRQLLLNYPIGRPVENIATMQSMLTDAASGIQNGSNIISAATSEYSAAASAEAIPAEDNVVAVNRDLAALMPSRAEVLNPNIKNLMKFVPTGVEEGRYTISDISIKGDMLHLTATGPDAGSTPVKLVVPAEILDKAGNLPNASRITAGRIDPNTGQKYTESIDDLLVKLNLKEIEIKFAGETAKTVNAKNAANVESTPNRLPSAQVQIVAENAGETLLIRSRVNKDQLRAFKSAPKLSPALSSKVSSETESMPLQTVQVDGDNPRIGTRLPEGGRVFDGFEQALKPVGDKPDLFGSEAGTRIKERIVESSNLEILTDKNGVPIEKSEKSSVRLVLPNDIKSTLKPDGKAVTIRIDPEHLGPAKLNLTMQSEGLRARLLVESSFVKTTVEAGLDRLVEQLNRADIKVNIIEVAVDGNSDRSDYSHRRPNWHRQPSRIGVDPTAEDAPAQVSQPRRVSPQATAYQGAGGINILV